MTNIVPLVQSSALALRLMIGEAGEIGGLLQLPVPSKPEARHIAECYVGPTKHGINGSIQISNVAFTFWDGKIHTITRTDLFPPEKITQTEATKLISSKVAQAPNVYANSTQWLAAISVDVARLEKEFQTKKDVKKYSFGQDSRTENRVGRHKTSKPETSLTFIEIHWHRRDEPQRNPWERPALKLTVLGNTGAVVDLQIANPDLLLRPRLVITNSPIHTSMTNEDGLIERGPPQRKEVNN